MVCSSGQWAINLKSILQKKNSSGSVSIPAWGGLCVLSFFLSPPSSIFLFIFAAPWLTGQSVAMECAVGQKKRRSRNSLTSWRGLTCFNHLSTLSPCLFLILSLVCSPPHLSFPTTLSHSFLVSALIYFDAGSGTPAWPFPPFSLSHTHKHKAVFLACHNTGLLHAHASHRHTLTNRNVWESPSGSLCNLHLKLVRGQEANRPGRVHANRRSWLAARLRSKILSA